MSCIITQMPSAFPPVRKEPGNAQNLDVLQPPDYRNSPPQMYAWSNDLRDTDILWPRSKILGAGGQDGVGSGQGGVLDAVNQQWEWNFPPTGVHVRKKVSGQVLDSNSNPVSGATVQLFNTSTGLLVDTQTSAVDGSFTCGDPNATNCFAVADL